MLNILSVDLEEWYHPEYVKDEAQSNKEERIQESLERTLRLLSRHGANATFFVVGELAERYPEAVEKIRENDHEVGFHGYFHEPLWELSKEKLHVEIVRFNSLIGGRCVGYRAPSFSLNNMTRWALEVLEKDGYEYDSSVFPVKTPLYGMSTAPMTPYKPSAEDITKPDRSPSREGMWEFPVLAYPLLGIRLPTAGGFYLRFFPVGLIKRAIRRMNKQGFPAVIFVHNWELDPNTPRLKLGLYKSFVTYHNIDATERKIAAILSSFRFTTFQGYLSEN